MAKYRVIVWNETDDDTIGHDFESWGDASDAGAEYCQASSYRFRIEQDDPD